MTAVTPLAVPSDSRSNEIDRIFAAQRENRARVGATDAKRRIAKVRSILDVMMSRRDEIRTAMWEDFRKPAAEVDLSEIYMVTTEAKHAIRHLKSWMRGRRVPTPLPLIGSSSHIQYEPKGVVLIISPWNFPFNLTFGPLVSAVAAGNCAILKPSELTPASSALMRRIVTDLFDENEVAVIEGDAEVSTLLLRKPWDHIFFTGSSQVGKVVMRAAAEHLTSVTLELGGKSPVIVDRSADLDDAARKVAWGKFLNSGQVCVAPDYLFVDEQVAQPFVQKLGAALDALGDGSGRPIVVNDRHAARVQRLLDDAVAGGATISRGGTSRGRDIDATVLTGVSPDAAIMTEEIFGPILPVLTYRDRAEVYKHIAANEKPLALYLFAKNRSVIREILARTAAGGSAVNHVVLQFFQPYLPFGGSGNSGIGKGHGFFGFEAFSNPRGVYYQTTPLSAITFMMPPYTKLKQKLIDLTIRWF
jgi:aldehyde dehydrogenase (NAD+)